MEAVILIGIQGSGKSTFYEQRFAATHRRISLDVLKTRPREREILRTCLANAQPFVVDNTSILAAERAVYIQAARAAGFRVIGYFLDIPLRDALRQNAQRAGTTKIPVAAVIGTFKRLQRPNPAEGFDELYVVRHDPAGRFAITPWSESEGAAHV